MNGQSAGSPIFKSKNNCIAVEVNGRRFLADFDILTAQSPYFRVRFELEKRKEREEGGSPQDAWPKIQSASSGGTFSTGLEFVATDALTTLQQYFCGDGLKLTERSVFYIMKLVGILKQDQLVPQCVDFIVKRLLRPKTVFGLKAAFDDVPLLVDKAIKYAQKNFLVIKETNEFLKLNRDELISLLKSDELLVDTENDVFAAAMRWLSFDIPNRRSFAASVLGAVRWPLLSADFLSNDVMKNLLAVSTCGEQISEAMAWQARDPEVCKALLGTEKVKRRLGTLSNGAAVEEQSEESLSSNLSHVSESDENSE